MKRTNTERWVNSHNLFIFTDRQESRLTGDTVLFTIHAERFLWFSIPRHTFAHLCFNANKFWSLTFKFESTIPLLILNTKPESKYKSSTIPSLTWWYSENLNEKRANAENFKFKSSIPFSSSIPSLKASINPPLFQAFAPQILTSHPVNNKFWSRTRWYSENLNEKQANTEDFKFENTIPFLNLNFKLENKYKPSTIPSYKWKYVTLYTTNSDH